MVCWRRPQAQIPKHWTNARHRGGERSHAGTSGNYDLVVLDVMLPDMKGFDVLRELRSYRVEVISEDPDRQRCVFWANHAAVRRLAFSSWAVVIRCPMSFNRSSSFPHPLAAMLAHV